MKNPTLKTALALSVASLLAALALGCDKKDAQRDSEDQSAASDAGPSKASKASKADTDEPDLARALGSVSAARPGAGAAASGGPPPNGIFGPGEADKAAAKGSPAALTLGSDGAEPRVLLGLAPKPGSKRSGTVELATQSDPQQGAIPIQFDLTLEVAKPKGEADAGAPVQTQVVAKVTSARINAPGVPQDLSQAVSKLKGSRVEYQVAADGAASNFHTDIPKGVDPAYRDPVQALSDLLGGITLPFPTKPVGVGAYWMVTSRDLVMGLDVVSYRLIKVEKVAGGVVSLSLNIKRYAASPAFELEGLPPDAPRVMGEFRGQSEGKLTVAPGQAFPQSSELQSLIGAALGAADAKQRPMVQVQSRATLTLSGS
jgi:hypothetical protein